MDENLDLNKNIELDKALKEFEAKSKIEEENKTLSTSENLVIPKITRLVMKWMGTKEQKQAEYFLLGFVIVAIAVSLYLFFGKNLIKSATQNSESEIFLDMSTGLPIQR